MVVVVVVVVIVCLSIYLSTYLSIYLPIYLFVCLSVCLPASLKTQQFCETSSFFKVDNIKNEAILREFLYVRTWQRQKQSNSARLLHFTKLTTSKTKQFCEISFKNGKLRAALTASYRVLYFPIHLFKLLRLPRKSDARSYEVLHLSRKIISANLKIWGSKMQPLSGNQRPDLLTALMNMSLVLRLPRKTHLCRSSSNVPHLPSFLEMPQNPHVLLTFHKVHNPLRLPQKRHLNVQKWHEHVVFLTFWLRNVLRATTACTFSTSQLPRVVRTCGVFNILTSKCASRHNCVHFLDIATSKSGPNMWCVLYILTWKCASRHNGVHFFNSKSGPNTVCFAHFDLEMCFASQRHAIFHLSFWPAGSAPAALASLLFDRPEPQIMEKQWFRDFPTLSRTCIFFLLILSLLWYSLFCSSLFCYSLLSDSSHLCFSSVHIVGSLNSKLPSTNRFSKWASWTWRCMGTLFSGKTRLEILGKGTGGEKVNTLDDQSCNTWDNVIVAWDRWRMYHWN